MTKKNLQSRPRRFAAGPLARTWRMSGVAPSKRRLAVIAIVSTSLATGFGEASLFYLIVQSASAASANKSVLDVHFGPIDAGGVGIDTALTISIAILACLLVL